mgnify:CR=1 FL=1
MTFWLILVLLLLALAWIFNGIRRIGNVSHGPKVEARPNRALLLIDLQTVFWDGDIYDNQAKSDAEAAVLSASARARKQGDPIIALRQEWSIPSTKLVARLMMKGQAIAGSAGTEVAAPFSGLADHMIVKRVQDAFETGELDQLLKTLNVGSLRIAGLDGNYCVAKTAEAAILRGYAVELAKEAILTADPKAGQKTFAALANMGVT